MDNKHVAGTRVPWTWSGRATVLMLVTFLLSLCLAVPAAFAAWTIQPSGTTEDLRRVRFTNGKIGWVTGENGTVLQTANGGRSWLQRNLGVTEGLWGLDFVGRSHGWIGGANGLLLRTTDGGATWTKTYGLVNRGFDLDFVDPLHGWAVGGAYWDGATGGAYVRTTYDRGATWTELLNGPSFNFYRTKFISATEGWVVGDGVLRTRDGGLTWQSYDLMPIAIDVCFPDASNGWISGHYGCLFRTSDGGDTWTRLTWPSTGSLTALCFTDAQNSIPCGDAELSKQSHLGHP